MSLRLPLASSPVRESVDLTLLASLHSAEGRAKLPGFREALNGARNFLEKCQDAKSVTYHCLRADGQLWLVEFTRKTWYRRWNFGSLTCR